jgi:hypothetical protein
MTIPTKRSTRVEAKKIITHNTPSARSNKNRQQEPTRRNIQHSSRKRKVSVGNATPLRRSQRIITPVTRFVAELKGQSHNATMLTLDDILPKKRRSL